MMLLALGWSQERIAAGCHISVPTLKRHYFSILKTRAIQRDRLVAWQLEKLMEIASDNNVGALKELQRMIEKNDLAVSASKVAKDEKADPVEKLGKKEIERRAALESSENDQGEWADLLSGGYDA